MEARSVAEADPSCDVDGLDSLQGDGEEAGHCQAGEAAHARGQSFPNRRGLEP